MKFQGVRRPGSALQVVGANSPRWAPISGSVPPTSAARCGQYRGGHTSGQAASAADVVTLGENQLVSVGRRERRFGAPVRRAAAERYGRLTVRPQPTQTGGSRASVAGGGAGCVTTLSASWCSQAAAPANRPHPYVPFADTFWAVVGRVLERVFGAAPQCSPTAPWGRDSTTDRRASWDAASLLTRSPSRRSGAARRAACRWVAGRSHPLVGSRRRRSCARVMCRPRSALRRISRV